MPWARSSLTVEGREQVVALFAAANKAFTPKLVKRAIFPAAELVRDTARANAPVGKGHLKTEMRHLKDSVFAAYGKPNMPDVIAGVDLKKSPHAHLVEFGTEAHPIRPKIAKWLRFPPKFWRVSAVQHPGAKKHPFLVPAIKSTRGRVATLIQEGLTNLLKRELSQFDKAGYYTGE